MERPEQAHHERRDDERADGDADQSKSADHDFTIGRASTRVRPTATILSVGGPAVPSSQSMSGSLRNHVRWRFANAWLRRASSAIAASSVELAIEDGPRLAVADRAERRERRVEPLAEGASLVDQAGVELGAGPVRDPLAVGRGLDLEADPGDRAVVAARRRQVRLAAGDGRDLERADDAPRIGRVDRLRASRRHGAEPLDERLEPDREELRLEPGADVGVGRQLVGRDAARDGPQVEPRAADEDREPSPLPDRRQRLASVGREIGDA